MALYSNTTQVGASGGMHLLQRVVRNARVQTPPPAWLATWAWPWPYHDGAGQGLAAGCAPSEARPLSPPEGGTS